MEEIEAQGTEITLGTGRLLGLFFCLVIVCALFFGLGFSLGRNSVKSTLTMEDTGTTTLAGQAAGEKSSPSTPERLSSAAQSPAVTSGSADQSGTNSEPVEAQAIPAANTPAPEVASLPISRTTASYAVQVAAVSKQEDAEALVSALKKKSYPVFIADSTDKLYHVQIGPFADLKDAEAMKARLTGDGYNPILKR